MSQEKIIIIGPKCLTKHKVKLANYLLMKNNDLSIVNTFTTDESASENQNSSLYYNYYIPFTTVEDAYKNDAIVYCTIGSKLDITHGVMKDEFYNNDIMYLDFIDFNNISNKLFDELDSAQTPVLIVWLDSSHVWSQYNNSYEIKEDVTESKYTLNKIENNCLAQLYFNVDNEHMTDIAETILEYYMTNDKGVRESIIFNNN